jgi:Flp pilus assembly protein TadG
MTGSLGTLGRRRRDERGVVALVSALVALVLMLVGALVIDLGSTWARRGQLQVQVDRAALLAAQRLPATDGPSRMTAAKYVAYYVACHVLPGQRQINPEIPACPSGTTPSSAAILTYAQHLLDTGAVTFPTTTQVRVVSPEARVDYSFGPLAGVDGSTQHKIAVAKVSSPGQIAPVGLSLPCLLSAAGNVPNGGDAIDGILPINYVTSGPLTPGGAQPTLWPSTYATAASGPVLSSVNTVPDPVVSGSPPATFTLTGSSWGNLGDVQVWFHKGPDTGTPVQASVNLPVVDPVTGTATVTGVLPDAVMQAPGTWEVKVGVIPPLLGTREWSAPMSFDVTMASGLTEAIGCGRLLDSPRADESDPALSLQKNLQLGLDHPLGQHPNLVSVTAPSLTPDQAVAAASDPTNAFACSSAPPHILDVPSPTGTPNCVRLEGNDAWVGTSFTEGMLGAESGGLAGRLVCSSTHPCTGPTATVRGVQINDDSFEQFVVDPSLLRSRMFFGLSTYVTNGVPVLSPQNALSEDLYDSHRFMWVPVMSTPLTPTSGGDYPILTFRPIFISQDAASGWTPYDMLWDQVDTVLASLGLAQSDVQHGLLMSDDGQTLEAFRFMTIEPTSLPLVSNSYSGPITDYVGVGPKIVGLTK